MQSTVLPNGIRIVVDPDERFHSASCVVCVAGGLRTEAKEQAGITHLLEHLIFKRTDRLDTKEVACIIDELGGEVNAMTDADSLCLYGTVPKTRFPRLLSFLLELLSRCAFTEEDLEVEKEIVRQELLESEDDPSSVVYKHFSELFWPGSILGMPVIGSTSTLERCTFADLRARYHELLRGSGIIIAAAGNVSFEDIVTEVERSLGALPSISVPVAETPKCGSGLSIMPRPYGQVHLALGCAWPAVADADFFAGRVLATLLGEGMSSRLFQVLREQYGLTYDVGAEIEAYPDTAALVISAAAERGSIPQVLDLIVGEISKVREDPLTSEEFERAVGFHVAQLEMEQDSVVGRVWRIVETLLHFGRYISVEETISLFERTSREDIERLARERFDHRQYLLVLGGDVDGFMVSERIRGYCGL